MQKISFYLLPNRITVRTDRTGFTTENRKVYQRKLRIYKGIDNQVEFEVLNGDSRKESVVGYEIKLKVFDANRNILIDDLTGQAIVGKPGLMAVTFTKELIADIDPQQLKVAAYLTNETEERILYSDSQYDLALTLELMDGYNGVEENIEELTAFNYEHDRAMFVSEYGNFGRLINDDYASVPNKTITVELGSGSNYQGIIEVEATKTKSTSIGNQWVPLESWDTAEDETKTYIGDYLFIRFKFGGRGPGSGAKFNVTIVDGVYQLVSVIHRGQGYRVGDELLIKGSYLGGDDGVNDLIITVNGINESPQGSINTTRISWTGTAINLPNAYFRNVSAVANDFTGPVDKIIIRS